MAANTIYVTYDGDTYWLACFADDPDADDGDPRPPDRRWRHLGRAGGLDQAIASAQQCERWCRVLKDNARKAATEAKPDA
jgi:hypothetical protein